MALTKDQILTEALALDPAERDEIAEALWQGNAPGELDVDQLLEIRRRIEEMDRGKVQAIPGEQVIQELRQRYQR